MARKKSNPIADDMDDDLIWGEMAEFTIEEAMNPVEKPSPKLNARARRLYDDYQEECRLRQILADDFDYH